MQGRCQSEQNENVSWTISSQEVNGLKSNAKITEPHESNNPMLFRGLGPDMVFVLTTTHLLFIKMVI